MTEETGNIDNASEATSLNPSDGSLLQTQGNETVQDTHPADVGGNASSSEMLEFIETLDETTKADDYLKRFENPKELAKSYVELRKLVGRKGEVPKDDATPEEWNEFYGKIGRPDTSEGYEINPLEGLVDDGRLSKSLELAHEVGLTKKQAETLFNGFMEEELNATKQLQEIQNQSLQAEAAKLQEAWGNSHDDMVNEVINLQKSLGIHDTFNEKGLNNDADLLIFMSKVADKFAESETVQAAQANTPAGIDDAISEVSAEILEFVKQGKAVPEHLTNRKTDLFRKRYG